MQVKGKIILGPSSQQPPPPKKSPHHHYHYSTPSWQVSDSKDYYVSLLDKANRDEVGRMLGLFRCIFWE